MPIIITVDSKLSEGDFLKIEDRKCRSIGCKNYELCNSSSNKNKKYKIIKIYEKIECPLDYDLNKAEISE